MTDIDRAALLALAERVEGLEGPDRVVDVEIATALGCGWDYAADWGPRGLERPVAYPYTASIDAAMMLVPEGWLVTHFSELGLAGGCVCALGNPETSQDATSDHGARTLALALTAVDLRAHAREME